jgi:hypothetical protein
MWTLREGPGRRALPSEILGVAVRRACRESTGAARHRTQAKGGPPETFCIAGERSDD